MTETQKPSYFDITEYIEQFPTVNRFYAVGQRGAGKTYSIKKYAINKWLENPAENKFVYVRRVVPDLATKILNRVFTDVIHEFDFSKLNLGDFYKYHILASAGDFYLYGETIDGELDQLLQCGTTCALSQATRFKNGTYLDYKTIIFDEFLVKSDPRAESEVDDFNKILLSVARSSNIGVKTFFAGNPDNFIERSRFLAPLKLDYAHLQNNTPYLFDTKINGKTYGNNILFIKLANRGEGYIDTSVIDVSNREIEMSLSGEVLLEHFARFGEDMKQHFTPYIELIVETPIITPTEYNKKIYAYIGDVYGHTGIIILTHILKGRTRDTITDTLFCRYNANDIRPRLYPQTYRLNIPLWLSNYKAEINDALTRKWIATDDDASATMFMDILINK